MKLFVTNKEDLDSDFQSIESRKAIHQKAYNKLLMSLGIDSEPPSVIEFDYKMFVIKFKLKNKVDGVYFYSYKRW